MGTESDTKPTVAVIGAGLTGLLAAQGLQKNGFRATVYDKDAGIDTRTRDWSLLLHWALPTMKDLLPEPVLQNFSKSICNPYLDFNDEVEAVPFYDGNTGDYVFSTPAQGSRRVSRQRLRKVLTEGVDIRWNTKLVDLQAGSEGVRLVFEDGTEDTVDYVLGCDGSFSKLRQVLLGGDEEAARIVDSGFMAATGIVRYGDEAKVNEVLKNHPVCAIMLGTSAISASGVLSVDNPADKSTWTIFWLKGWPKAPGSYYPPNGREALDYMRGENGTRNLCEPFRSALSWMPDGSQCNIDEMKYWIPVPFDCMDGRVTLAGDAAHPMLPARGQGMQHSITDVNNYIEALVRLHAKGGSPEASERKEAIEQYGAEIVKRGAVAVQQSVSEYGKWMNPIVMSELLAVKHGAGRTA